MSEAIELEPIPDTIPPPGETHGFLEQFTALSAESFVELEKVVALGLSGKERTQLMVVGLKLMHFAFAGAKEEDFSEEDKALVETAIAAIDNTLTSHS